MTALDLSSNGLAGRIPTALAQLTRMARLKIDDNAGLAGPLPLSLRELSLEEFDYESTGLCAPPDPSFGEWLASMSSHEGTGRECAPLSDREILSVLYHAAGGTRWIEAEDWASDRWVGGWSGVRIDNLGRVNSLSLSRNNLSGKIPPELAGLTSLSTLVLDSNDLSWTHPAGTGQAVQPEGADSRFQRPERPDPARVGQPVQPGGADSQLQRPDRTDPRRAWQSLQPEHAVARFKQPDRTDSAGTGQPLQRGGPSPVGERSDRTDSGRSWASSRA